MVIHPSEQPRDKTRRRARETRKRAGFRGAGKYASEGVGKGLATSPESAKILVGLTIAKEPCLKNP